jgi:predicted RNA-binding protein Jag
VHENQTTSDIEQMAGRAGEVVRALCEVWASAGEDAVERLKQSLGIHRMKQHIEVQAAVLALIHVQKTTLVEQAKAAHPVLAAFFLRQVEQLGQQELGILVGAGVPEDEASQALQIAAEPLYERKGKRFQRLAHVNGQG